MGSAGQSTDQEGGSRGQDQGGEQAQEASSGQQQSRGFFAILLGQSSSRKLIVLYSFIQSLTKSFFVCLHDIFQNIVHRFYLTEYKMFVH